VKYLFHNVTIDEIPTIPEFRALPSFKSFLTKAYKIYTPGDPQLFAIAITEEPIALSNSIPYVYKKGVKIQPNIIPGRKTTLSKILKATTLEDLY